MRTGPIFWSKIANVFTNTDILNCPTPQRALAHLLIKNFKLFSQVAKSARRTGTITHAKMSLTSIIMLVIPLVYKLTHHQRPLTVALKHWPIWIELFFFYSYHIFVFKHGVIWIELFLAFFFSDFQQHRDLSISVIVHLLIPKLNKFKTNWAIALWTSM